MKDPTKADLAAAVAKLTQENAGLRDLLAAVSECARAVPQAVYDDRRLQLSRATSVLIDISVVTDPGGSWAWSWGSGQGAAHLLDRADEPPGYEVYVKPEPPNPPHHMTGDMPGPDCLAEDGGYICNAQDGPEGQECRRWPVAADKLLPEWVADGALWTNGNMRVERVEDDAFLPMVGLTGGPVCGSLLEAAQWCTRYAASHVTAKAESDEPEPGTQAYADKYSSRTVQRELLGETPQDDPASPDAAEALIDAITAGTPVKPVSA